MSNNGGDIFPKFSDFFINRGCGFFILAGYFTSETIMALSDGNITTFFIQKQGTNEKQHIYFGGRHKTTLGTQHNSGRIYTKGRLRRLDALNVWS